MGYIKSANLVMGFWDNGILRGFAFLGAFLGSMLLILSGLVCLRGRPGQVRV